MRISTKLVLGAMLLALVPVVVSNLLVGSKATTTSHNALEAASQDRLKSVRDTTKARLSDYLQNLENLILTLSSNPSTINAAISFSSAFKEHTAQAGNFGKANEFKQEVTGFLSSDFQGQYRTMNPGKSAPVQDWANQMSEKALEFQSIFIANNPNPLGEKHNLVDIQDYTTYEQFHESYHPTFVQYLETFGFYDIFIVDPKNGHIIYSVFKEVDYATSLDSGPFKNTGIAEVYRQAKNAKNSDFIAFTDFAPYPPSYESPASFMASPISDDTGFHGVLIFQMPLDIINGIMTHDKNWSNVGLGDSGETYLVGKDNKLRSDSRFLLEDPEGYTKALADSGMDQNILSLIQARETGIGLQSVNSDSIKAALNGEEGFLHIFDYRNVEVLSAFTPLEFRGVTWALVAEIDEAEAFVSANEVSNTIATNAIIVFVIVAVIAIASSYVFSKSLSTPIIRLKEHLETVGSTADLTMVLEPSGKDEISDITRSFNTMMAKFRDSLHKVSDASSQLSAASEQTMSATQQTLVRAQEQLSQSSQAATAMNEMTATVQEVANHTNEAANATNEANQATQTGRENVEELINTIESLASRLSSAGEVTDRLSKESDQINTVVDVIRNIAEQTNLLALNAAIEAARAGEQGRGFAVVADEVRALAGKTHDSTQEINQMVEALQKGSKDTVEAIEASLAEVQNAVAKTDDAGQSLNSITESVNTVNEMNLQIATTAEEQISVSEEINQNITHIAEMAEKTDEDAKQTSQSAQSVARLSEQLAELISCFKI
ncbi:methyl-accepting chemotaxis protein [Litoribrevibacter euphylliae]|uniref:Methyl-accepting chemotaxis protein n=1 Tax=Litoribrevibacter euphylliae TaxID=1834034 RepID=A0ABV7HGC7_9GAMM